MFLYFPLYLSWFYLLEHFITTDYWVSYLPVDDKIPFVPFFIVFYVLWFPNVILPAFLLYFTDTAAFKRYAYYVIISFSLSMTICMFFPNGQDLRPVLPQNGDFFTSWVGLIYSADTNTNVLPSMHVVGCVGTTLALWDSRHRSARTRRCFVPLLLLQFLICISTLFVKQHSVLDLAAGLVLGVAVGAVVYGAKSPLRKPPRADELPARQWPEQ